MQVGWRKEGSNVMGRTLLGWAYRMPQACVAADMSSSLGSRLGTGWQTDVWYVVAML